MEFKLSGTPGTQKTAGEEKVRQFLARFPEYRSTLRLAVTHEQTSDRSRTYQGWRWHDVETHPTRLIRLVTEGITKINLKTRQATYYLLKDRDAVARCLEELSRAEAASLATATR